MTKFIHNYENIDAKYIFLKVDSGEIMSLQDAYDLGKLGITHIPENFAPKIDNDSITVTTNYLGEFTITYIATDENNDILSHKLKIDTDNYIIINPQQQGNTFTYAGSGLSTGNHNIYIQVTDGKETVESNKLTINIPNPPIPEISNCNVVTVSASGDYTIKYNANGTNLIHRIKIIPK